MIGACRKDISRPNFFRRQLHFENPVNVAPNHRKRKVCGREYSLPRALRKGGTVTPFGFRSGDLVKVEKAGIVYIGWIGGYTQTEKTKKISVYDHNWHRLGQFSPTKVKFFKRSSRLCVAV
ncbi:MAG: hypothetical protein PUP92_20515 [Rhizonema sp. PD38]|nr:hypothetical protein [Rhizonema sp. PD38]